MLRLLAKHFCFGRYGAYADGYGQTAFAHGVGPFQRLFELSQFLGKVGCAVDCRHKFIPAETGGEVLAGKLLRQTPRKFDQNFVACHMPISIVDHLEIV